MQLSKRTRSQFAEFATSNMVIRLIDQAFMSEDFEAAPESAIEGFVSGARRTLVAQYHAGIDFSDPAQTARLVDVYVNALEAHGRNWEGEWHVDAQLLIKSMRKDGVPIDDDGNLTAAVVTLNVPVSSFARLDEPRVVQQHLERISANIERDPAAAIGSCKELVESVCRFILDDYGVEHAPGDDLLALYKKTANALKLNREAVPDSAKGSASAQRVLQNLATAVQSLAELRNELGIGHGRTKTSPAFARHARLAFNSSRAVVEFLLETWHVRKAADTSSAAAS